MFKLAYVIFIFNIYVNAIFDGPDDQVSLEILEDGKNQYKLLQERGELPQYGECWKAVMEHIHQRCNHLSENVQSDIALRITNCFLAMSGHDTYNCDRDKKPNLRGICINSMTDRAFNVYTEFYTHAQNICWFLRGQVWQEKMSEIALRSSKQLHVSLEKHEVLLQRQNYSLQLQERLLEHGKSLEMLLNESRSRTQAVIDDIQASTLEHQRLLNGLVNGLAGLQSWLVGEISWFDTVLFYTGGIFIILAVTSAECTASARLPLFLVFSLNVLLERTISNIVTQNTALFETHLIHESLQNYIWWCRRSIVLVCILILCTKVYVYQNYKIINNILLVQIREQNHTIYTELEALKSLISKNSVNSRSDSLYNTNEKTCTDSPEGSIVCSTPTVMEHFEKNVTRRNRYCHEKTILNGDLSQKSSSRYNLRMRS